jgi:hypothetical protein
VEEAGGQLAQGGLADHVPVAQRAKAEGVIRHFGSNEICCVISSVTTRRANRFSEMLSSPEIKNISLAEFGKSEL